MFLEIDKKPEDRLVAIQDDGARISYGELVSFCREVEHRISKRNLVFSLCSNVIASLAGYVAFLDSENVPLLLNEELDRELLQYLLQTYAPNYI